MRNAEGTSITFTISNIWLTLPPFQNQDANSILGRMIWP